MLPVGCIPPTARLESVSSGQIGCPVDQINITNEQLDWPTRTWTAQCAGRTYFCSEMMSKAEQHVACKERAGSAQAMPPPPAPPAASPQPGGCQYDAQCKGDRICRNGSCVDPTPK
jgi:hypothetical protein